MSRFSNSVTLFKESWSVLRQDKELVAIPVVSAVICVVVAAIFGGGAYFTLETVTDPQVGDSLEPTPLTYAVGVVGLLIIGIVAQFFAGVLIAGANERLAGGSPTLGSAFAKAKGHFGALVGWAAMNVTVGLILSAIADRAGPLGAIAMRLVGMAWNVVTWLAVPAIVIEGHGPVDGVKRSVELLKATWGENVIAQAGIGLIGMLVMLAGIVVFGALSFVLPIVGIPLLVIYIAATSAVLAALGGIYRAALYRYAVGLPNGGAFPEEALAAAFKPKTGINKYL
jgi:hypothetical protein